MKLIGSNKMRMTKRFDEPGKVERILRSVLFVAICFFCATILPPLIEILVFGSSDYY